MNRLLSIDAACLFLAALSMSAASAAPALTLSSEDVLGANWNMIVSGTLANGTPFSNDTGVPSPPSYSGEFTTSSTYGAPLSPGFVGLVGCGIGDNDSLEYVSLALSGATFTGFDTYAVVLINANDDPWQYRLLADDGDTTVLGPWTAINPGGGTQSLSVDISGLDGTGLIGFQIGSDVREDCFHTSVAPAGTSVAVIPAPGALLLGAIGSLLVHRFRIRKYI